MGNSKIPILPYQKELLLNDGISVIEPMEDYLSSPFVGSSTLAETYFDGYEEYLFFKQYPNLRPKESESQKFGKLCDLILWNFNELLRLNELLVCGDARSNDAKARKKEVQESGGLFLPESWKEEIDILKDILLKNKTIESLLQNIPNAVHIGELSHYVNYKGLDVKVRPDILMFPNDKDFFYYISVKSTNKINPIDFRQSAEEFHYPFKEQFYIEVLEYLYGKTCKFACITIENKIPYRVVVYNGGYSDMELETPKIEQAILDYKKYQETGDYVNFLDKKGVPFTGTKKTFVDLTQIYPKWLKN